MKIPNVSASKYVVCIIHLFEWEIFFRIDCRLRSRGCSISLDLFKVWPTSHRFCDIFAMNGIVTAIIMHEIVDYHSIAICSWKEGFVHCIHLLIVSTTPRECLTIKWFQTDKKVFKPIVGPVWIQCFAGLLQTLCTQCIPMLEVSSLVSLALLLLKETSFISALIMSSPDVSWRLHIISGMILNLALEQPLVSCQQRLWHSQIEERPYLL